MDEASPTRREWAPDRRTLLLEAIAAPVAVGVAVALAVTGDPLGTGLALAAALLLIAVMVRDLVWRPVLTVDADGVCVVDGITRRCFPWNTVTRIRAGRSSRFTTGHDAVEIDVERTVIVVHRRRLGAPAEEVVAACAEVAELSRRGWE